MFIGVAILILFSSFSLIGTILAIRLAPFLFSEIWLFNAVCTNLTINAALLVALILLDYSYFEFKIISHALYAAIIASLIHVAFFGVVVVSFDRSISVYFLSSMYEREENFRTKDLEALLWEGYFIGQSATKRRIEEQTHIGNMAINSTGEIYLTDKGRRFVEMSRIIAQLYNTRQEFLWPNGAE